jgi:hypothetical protein
LEKILNDAIYGFNYCKEYFYRPACENPFFPYLCVPDTYQFSLATWITIATMFSKDAMSRTNLPILMDE